MQNVRQRWLWGTGIVVVLLILASCTIQMPTPGATTAESEPMAEAVVMEEREMTEEGVALLPVEAPPFSTGGWSTNFDRRLVEWEEILSGGPPKDGIPSVDDPTFESVGDASDWLTDRDPVIFFEHNDDIRAYPLAILIWHEIVNDEVGGMPVAVTFCPLCNASIVFDATIDGVVHEFGTTGRLRNSDLIMYDRVTESWWQQFTGEAIVGDYTGRQLTFLASQVISCGDFAAEFPDDQVMARPGMPVVMDAIRTRAMTAPQVAPSSSRVRWILASPRQSEWLGWIWMAQSWPIPLLLLPRWKQ